MKGFTTWELRDICVKNDWFTGGSCEAYDKLFARCEENASIEELALIIWVCTPDSNRELIKNALYKERIRKNMSECLAILEDWREISSDEVIKATREIVKLRREYEEIERADVDIISEDFADE